MEQDHSALPGARRITLSPDDTMVKDVVPENLSVRDFAQLVGANVMAWRRLRAYFKCAMMEIETKFRVLDEQFSLQYDRNPIESIKTRIKEPESILEKMLRKQLAFNLHSVENCITDMAGVRVICSFPDDIYMLRDCLLQQDDITLIREKDYIKSPKANGYRGLHLIVEVPIFLQNEKRQMKVEVQLRTIAMDFWASLEHKLRYKKNLSPELSATLETELYDCATMTEELDLKMQKIRQQIELENT